MPDPDALPTSPALLEGALPDLLREDAASLASLVPGLAARRDDPAAERLLALLARTPAAGPARLAALRAVRGDDRTPATTVFATELGALVARLPASPLKEKLLRAAIDSPEISAKAFAAAFEAARASGDAALLARAREKLAPSLASVGLAAAFDRASDPAAFDERPAPVAVETLGRPAVRARSGAVLVRGVVFVARPPAPPEDPFERAIRAALADPPAEGAREAALVALSQALVAKLSGSGSPPSLAKLRDELLRAQRSPFVETLEKGLASLA